MRMERGNLRLDGVVKLKSGMDTRTSHSFYMLVSHEYMFPGARDVKKLHGA